MYLEEVIGLEVPLGQVGERWVPDAEGWADAAVAGVAASGEAAAGRLAAGLPTAAADDVKKANLQSVVENAHVLYQPPKPLFHCPLLFCYFVLGNHMVKVQR